MIRLFASDMDGTLLPSNHQVDELVKTAVEKIVNSGVYFATSTGRDAHMSRISGLEDRIYCICMNGAYILGPSQKVLKIDAIDKAVVKQLLEEFEDIDLEFVSPEKIYTKQSKEKMMETLKNMPRPREENEIEVSQFFMENLVVSMHFDSTNEEILNADICKINAHLKPGLSYNRIYKFIENNQDKIVNAPCDKNLMEMTAYGVNKGNAVHWLAQYLNLKDEEVAVYGDGGNDLQMLSMFEHSYAPNNAIDDAKYAAKYIIGPNNEYSVLNHILTTISRQSNK